MTASASEQGESASVTSDTTGSYQFTELERGLQFIITVRAAGYVTATAQVAMSREGDPQPLNFTLRLAASVAGRVVDTEGRPVPEVFVKLDPNPTGNNLREMTEGNSVEAQADSRSHFRLTDVGPGVYRFLVHCESFAVDALNEPLWVREGAAKMGVVVVVPVANELAIAGCVTNQEGAGIPDVQVVGESIYGFHREDDGSFNRAKTRTDSSGSFRLAGVADPIDLMFDPPDGGGYAKAWLNNVAPGTLDANAVLAAGSVLQGVVVDTQTSQPLDKFEVKVWRLDGPDGMEGPPGSYGQVQTGSGPGEFRIKDISPGQLELLVSAPDHAAKLVRGIAIEPGETRDLRIALDTPCILEGRITVNGQPPDPATFSTAVEAHSEEHPTLTNRLLCSGAGRDGSFRYTDLPEGTYLVRAGIWARAGVRTRTTQQTMVTLQPGQTTRADFELGGPCGIKGFVTAPEGSARCVVIVYDPSQVPERPTDCLIYGIGEFRIEGAQGPYELRNLPPGTYLVTAYASDVRFDYRRAQTVTVSLAAGQVLEQDFDLTQGVAPGIPLSDSER